jgi:hypothetical protein
MSAARNLSVRSTLRGLTNPRKVLLSGALCLALFASQINAPDWTRLELTDAQTGRTIVTATLRDGEPIVLMWRNSLFDLDVTEEFVTENGVLIQTAVTFADPRGVPPPAVAPGDVDDLYHTGGAFSARGLRRPFTRIAYRVSEIGNPQMTIGARVIEFKREVGFGGSIVLTTRAVNVAEAIVSVFAATILPQAR